MRFMKPEINSPERSAFAVAENMPAMLPQSLTQSAFGPLRASAAADHAPLFALLRSAIRRNHIRYRLDLPRNPRVTPCQHISDRFKGKKVAGFNSTPTGWFESTADI
jgi:hypothetical protein